ncbi:MAG: c-type cytochrome [Planctomycetota bacterium]
MRVQRSLFALLATSWLASALDAQDMERARKLFVTNCAACHGESGDGKGTTELDRPARSFQDGGFSFGNTPEALFKTISTGIPGSPMAGFDSSLTEEERHLVAAYVVTLGPPITEVKEEDMILTVKDKPLVVRGLLPSLGEGLPQTPRGLLIGDPSGITFEYRVDDVRLLALRQGGFVKRTDWTGRGGTELEPLGKVVHLVEGGKPEPMFTTLTGQALECRLSGTRIDEVGRLDYHLVRERREVAHVEEAPEVLNLEFGTGYVRYLRLTAPDAKTQVQLRDPTQGPGNELYSSDHKEKLFGDELRILASVRKSASGQLELRLLSVPKTGWARKEGALILELAPKQKVGTAIGTIPLTEWNDKVQKQWEATWEK